MWKQAEKKDFPQIQEMCEALYSEDPSPDIKFPRENMQKTLQEFERVPVRGVAAVYVSDDSCVAYAILSSFWSNELGGEVCTIDELFTKKEFRGRGIAKELFQSLQTKSAVWPRETVALELEVTPDNHRSRGLYERVGFRTIKNSLLRKYVSKNS